MKKKNYRLKQVIYTALSILFVVAPLMGWVVYRRDAYFSQGNYIKLGLGFMLTMVFVLLILKGAFKKIHPTTNTVIMLLALLFLTNLLDAVLIDLGSIIFWAIIGYACYIPLDMLASINKRKADVMLDEKIVQEVRGNGRA